MPNLVRFDKQSYHAGKDVLIRPFIEKVLTEDAIWQEIFSSPIKQQNVQSILQELSQLIQAIPPDDLFYEGEARNENVKFKDQSKIRAANALDYTNYMVRSSLTTGLYICTLNDNTQHTVRYDQILAAAYRLLIKDRPGCNQQELKQEAANIFVRILQNKECIGGRANTCVEHYNYVAKVVVEKFECLTLQHAADMFEKLKQCSNIFYNEIIPHPKDNVVADYNNPLIAFLDDTVIRRQSDYLINLEDLRGKRQNLLRSNAQEYLIVSQKHFKKDNYAALFAAIVVRDTNLFSQQQPLTLESIYRRLTEIDHYSDVQIELNWESVFKRKVTDFLNQEKNFLQQKFRDSSPREISIIVWSEAIVYGGFNKNIRLYIEKITEQEQAQLFGLPLDEQLLHAAKQAASNLAEDLRLLNVQLYEVIPSLLGLQDGSIKKPMIGAFIGSNASVVTRNSSTSIYNATPEIRSPKVFLQICWALLEECIGDANANKDAMRALVVGEDEDGDAITLADVIGDSKAESHFGNCSDPSYIRSATQALQDFRKWVMDNKSGRCPCSLHPSEIDQLEMWGAAVLVRARPAAVVPAPQHVVFSPRASAVLQRPAIVSKNIMPEVAMQQQAEIFINGITENVSRLAINQDYLNAIRVINVQPNAFDAINLIIAEGHEALFILNSQKAIFEQLRGIVQLFLNFVFEQQGENLQNQLQQRVVEAVMGVAAPPVGAMPAQLHEVAPPRPQMLEPAAPQLPTIQAINGTIDAYIQALTQIALNNTAFINVLAPRLVAQNINIQQDNINNIRLVLLAVAQAIQQPAAGVVIGVQTRNDLQRDHNKIINWLDFMPRIVIPVNRQRHLINEIMRIIVLEHQRLEAERVRQQQAAPQSAPVNLHDPATQRMLGF